MQARFAVMLLAGCVLSRAAFPGSSCCPAKLDKKSLAVSDMEKWQQGPSHSVTLADIPILKTVLRQSDYYTVDNTVGVKGYYYEFTVRHGEQTTKVVSVRELVKLCNEIEMIERYTQNEQGSHVMKGVGQAARGIGSGFKNLFRHPGISGKRVGQGAGRFFRATGGMFSRKKAPQQASDGSNRALMGAGPAGGERRLMAWEMGIDVYTLNQSTSEFINTIARKRLMGKLPLNATVFALPGGSIFTLSLTPMGHDPTTEDMIRDFSPDELKRQLGFKYKEQFGFDGLVEGSPINLLLENPNYSPREQAYLWRYLTDLGSLKGVEDAVSFLAQVKSPGHACIVSAQIELLALLHSRAKRLKQFTPVRNTLGALAQDGTLCLVISIDTVRFWGDVRTSLELTLATAREYKAAKSQIWSTGDIDDKSTRLAHDMGVEVYQNILANPVFQKPREDTLRRMREKSAAVENEKIAAKVPADGE